MKLLAIIAVLSLSFGSLLEIILGGASMVKKTKWRFPYTLAGFIPHVIGILFIARELLK